jgi:superfamily I DNA and RNA helicase
MLEVVRGRKPRVFNTEELVESLAGLDLTGTLYIGYPVIATADEPVVVEALLTSLENGVVVFDFQTVGMRDDPSLLEDRQNDLHGALFQKLFAFKPLRSGRSLSIPIEIVTITPTPAVARPNTEPPLAASLAQLPALVATFPPLEASQLQLVNAAIQRVTTIKPSNKRATVTKANSRGAIMHHIERQIANLDHFQKQAAIESPDAPQRIRGLAGSGKTVVLALKAAYLHVQNPDWDIVVTFHTRALKQQFTDLIRRFSFEHLNDEPNWAKLRVMHSWGSSANPGVYSEIASRNGGTIHDFSSARQRFGYDGAFNGVCEELLKEVKARHSPAQIFDAILIDEAQDVPQPFFELAYLATRNPKRIVWGYDELQNLGAFKMTPPAELFGSDSKGEPNVGDLDAAPDEPRRDIILPVCYRNTPWALTTAHAIGFGVYRRPEGLVQYFDDPHLWADVGYAVVDGSLDPGNDVELERRRNSYPSYFTDYLDPSDAVESMVFNDRNAQAGWVAESISQNVSEDELDLKDILVILSNPKTASRDAAKLIAALSEFNIPAHIAGVTTSVDQLFQDDSVAITGIYRAKGNEAPMVYILDSDYCAGGEYEVIKRRNILFTAITRSRAWVRICGCGPTMVKLKEEIDAVQTHKYRLAFRVPTEKESAQLRKIHRDRS